MSKAATVALSGVKRSRDDADTRDVADNRGDGDTTRDVDNRDDGSNVGRAAYGAAGESGTEEGRPGGGATLMEMVLGAAGGSEEGQSDGGARLVKMVLDAWAMLGAVPQPLVAVPQPPTQRPTQPPTQPTTLGTTLVPKQPPPQPPSTIPAAAPTPVLVALSDSTVRI